MVELFREHEILGLPFEERFGGTGTGTLMVLVAIEEISKVCATTGLILALQELGALAIKNDGTDEQKERYLPRLASGEWLPAYALTEPGSGLRLGRDALRGAARRRRVRPERLASASSRTRASRASTSCSRRPTRTPATRASRLSSSRRRRRASRSAASSRRWGSRARRPARSSSTTAACRWRTCSARRARASGSRCASSTAPAGHRRAGARDRAGCDRLRARVREDPRDDGQADRRAPAHRRQARRDGDEMRGARGLLYKVGQMIDEGVEP